MVGRSALVGICVAAGLAGRAQAASLSLDDIKLWAGSGTAEAGLVIDWNDGVSPHALEWGYRWDAAAYPEFGGPTGEDMMKAVAAADPQLQADIANWPGLGDYVASLGYGEAHFAAGWNWTYYNQESYDDSWQLAWSGFTDRVLSDGSWDGWSYGDNWPADEPSAPFAVPEPASVSLLGWAAAGLLLRRRK